MLQINYSKIECLRRVMKKGCWGSPISLVSLVVLGAIVIGCSDPKMPDKIASDFYYAQGSEDSEFMMPGQDYCPLSVPISKVIEAVNTLDKDSKPSHTLAISQIASLSFTPACSENYTEQEIDDLRDAFANANLTIQEPPVAPRMPEP